MSHCNQCGIRLVKNQCNCKLDNNSRRSRIIKMLINSDMKPTMNQYRFDKASNVFTYEQYIFQWAEDMLKWGGEEQKLKESFQAMSDEKLHKEYFDYHSLSHEEMSAKYSDEQRRYYSKCHQELQRRGIGYKNSLKESA